jgi:Big-like domain-containing protein/PKD domain-containing protein
MVTHARLRLRAATVFLLPAIVALSVSSACDKVPLLAPTGTVITLFASSSTVPASGEIEIIATLIENGTAAAPSTGTGGTTTTTTSTSNKGSGTPVQNGTLVSFTTTIGRIEPREARTQNGEVHVKFLSAGQSGNATITAYSGGASATLKDVLVGSAAAKRVVVTAGAIGPSGGSAEIQARVEDDSGNGITGVPVTFSTTAGTLSAGSAITDANGIARTTLTTDRDATVTATAGAQKADVTVKLAPRLISGFTAAPAATQAGKPVTFTVNTTANLQDATINFGDGTSQSLGSFATTATAAHVYSSPSTYTPTVTARDALGNTQSQSTTVTISALPVTLTAAPNPATVGSPVVFSVGGTTDAQVSRYEWTFDDGRRFTTSGPQLVQSFDSRGQKVVRADVIGVNGGLLGSAETRITVQ